MLRELSATDDEGGRLHAPVGLDIGAKNPAEIAVSIIAEIRAVLDGRSGRSLRERENPIHCSEERLAPVVAA
jgi:xanthine dehydrogenase accessory factor